MSDSVAPNTVEVRTSSFGLLTVPEDEILHFSGGLYGFSKMTRFVLIPAIERVEMFFLQSVDDGSLAFFITDPSCYFPEYRVPVTRQLNLELGLGSAECGDGQVLVILNNRIREDGVVTANLKGPIVINKETGQGKQIILGDTGYGVDEPLFEPLQGSVA